MTSRDHSTRARRRFYVAPGALDQEQVIFAPREAHHIAHVLRLRPGARLMVFDGTREAEAELVAVERDEVTARCLGPLRVSRRPVEITLLQGIARGPKMDLIVRMGTEIGLAAIHPVLTERGISDPGALRASRWQRIALEAARQCGRGDIPQIGPPAALETVLATVGPVDLLVVPWEEETRPIGDVITGRAYGTAGMLIGPEGGLTPREVEGARRAGGETVSLGPLVLRTETAGLVTAAILLYERLLRARSG